MYDNGRKTKDNRKNGEDGGKKRGALRGLAMLASMGITMVVATFIGLFIGIYIDRRFSTRPFFTIIFLLLGIAAGFRNIYLMVRKYGS